MNADQIQVLQGQGRWALGLRVCCCYALPSIPNYVLKQSAQKSRCSHLSEASEKAAYLRGYAREPNQKHSWAKGCIDLLAHRLFWSCFT